MTYKYEQHEWGTAVKVRGVRQYVLPFALFTRLDTRGVYAEVWDDKHGFVWSGQHHYGVNELLWGRTRKA